MKAEVQRVEGWPVKFNLGLVKAFGSWALEKVSPVTEAPDYMSEHYTPRGASEMLDAALDAQEV
jgi:hypothetical protein